jgi:energy-coupling factor transporter transmembrane protein EcfT
LAFAASTLLITIVLVGFRPSRVGIDFVAALASQAPFLIGSALYGWFVYFNQKAKKKPYRSERTPA